MIDPTYITTFAGKPRMEDPMTPEPLTCEQRRARAYGIDEARQEHARPKAWQNRPHDPMPRSRDYLDPIVFARDWADWKERNPQTFEATQDHDLA